MLFGRALIVPRMSDAQRKTSLQSGMQPSLQAWRFSHLPDAAATGALAGALAPLVLRGDLLFLHGELGCGKTTFVRYLVAAHGGDDNVVHSPTFSLVHQYECGAGRPPILHLDCYRLSGAEEWESLGVDDELATAITCIEWPERVAEALPTTAWEVHLRTTVTVGGEAVVTPARPWSPGAFAPAVLDRTRAEATI